MASAVGRETNTLRTEPRGMTQCCSHLISCSLVFQTLYTHFAGRIASELLVWFRRARRGNVVRQGDGCIYTAKHKIDISIVVSEEVQNGCDELRRTDRVWSIHYLARQMSCPNNTPGHHDVGWQYCPGQQCASPNLLPLPLETLQVT